MNKILFNIEDLKFCIRNQLCKIETSIMKRIKTNERKHDTEKSLVCIYVQEKLVEQCMYEQH